MEKYQNIVIDFGKGGKTLAKALALKGESVLVVEKSIHVYGGTYVNIDCILPKSLIFNGERGVDFVKAVARKGRLAGVLRAKNYHMINDEVTGTVVDGTACFLSNHQIEVTNNGKKVIIEGERVFINAGFEPIILSVKRLNTSHYLIDSTQAMGQGQLPEKLVIIGAGYIGLEFASMFNEYGSRVVVLGAYPEFLPREDEDITQMILEDITNAGIEFHLSVSVGQVADQESTAAITFTKDGQGAAIQASKVLAVTERRPSTASLGLENADVRLTDRGATAVDGYLRTDVDNIQAIGDVKGGLQFAYISLNNYRVIMDQLKGENTRTTNNRKVVSHSVFITPALSNARLTEKQAKAQDANYKLSKHMTSDVPKIQVSENPKEASKVLVDPGTDLVLGASIYAGDPHEIIDLILLAMDGKLPYTLLRDQVYSHPTVSEALNDVLK